MFMTITLILVAERILGAICINPVEQCIDNNAFCGQTERTSGVSCLCTSVYNTSEVACIPSK